MKTSNSTQTFTDEIAEAFKELGYNHRRGPLRHSVLYHCATDTILNAKTLDDAVQAMDYLRFCETNWYRIPQEYNQHYEEYLKSFDSRTYRSIKLGKGKNIGKVCYVTNAFPGVYPSDAISYIYLNEVPDKSAAKAMPEDTAVTAVQEQATEQTVQTQQQTPEPEQDTATSIMDAITKPLALRSADDGAESASTGGDSGDDDSDYDSDDGDYNGDYSSDYGNDDSPEYSAGYDDVPDDTEVNTDTDINADTDNSLSSLSAGSASPATPDKPKRKKAKKVRYKAAVETFYRHDSPVSVYMDSNYFSKDCMLKRRFRICRSTDGEVIFKMSRGLVNHSSVKTATYGDSWPFTVKYTKDKLGTDCMEVTDRRTGKKAADISWVMLNEANKTGIARIKLARYAKPDLDLEALLLLAYRCFSFGTEK